MRFFQRGDKLVDFFKCRLGTNKQQRTRTSTAILLVFRNFIRRSGNSTADELGRSYFTQLYPCRACRATQ